MSDFNPIVNCILNFGDLKTNLLLLNYFANYNALGLNALGIIMLYIEYVYNNWNHIQ